MPVILCKESNELVSFSYPNPNMLTNIYEQEDGILICLNDGTHNIEALVSTKQPVLDVLRKLELTDVFEVDQLYVGRAEEHEEDADGEDAEDGGDENWEGDSDDD